MNHLQEKNHIELRPGLRGQRPFVAGHRVRVANIVLWNEEGLSADEIVSRIPTISLADVHAALAYYFDHRAEIDRQIEEDNEFASEMEAVGPKLGSPGHRPGSNEYKESRSRPNGPLTR